MGQSVAQPLALRTRVGFQHLGGSLVRILRDKVDTEDKRSKAPCNSQRAYKCSSLRHLIVWLPAGAQQAAGSAGVAAPLREAVVISHDMRTLRADVPEGVFFGGPT